MAIKTDAELLAEANIIKAETAAGANSADRIGTMHVDTIDSKLNKADYTALSLTTVGSSGAASLAGGVLNVPNYSPVLNTAIINIGDWNMDSTTTKLVAHGISDITKIRSIKVIIRPDSGSPFGNLIFDLCDTGIQGANSSVYSYRSGALGGVDVTYIELNRVESTYNGLFDSTSFDSTSYNRGWITIQYIS